MSKQRECHPRKRFRDADSARAAAQNVARWRGLQRLPEPCSHCNGYHLSQPIKQW